MKSFTLVLHRGHDQRLVPLARLDLERPEQRHVEGASSHVVAQDIAFSAALLVDAAIMQALHDEAPGITEINHANLLEPARDMSKSSRRLRTEIQFQWWPALQ